MLFPYLVRSLNSSFSYTLKSGTFRDEEDYKNNIKLWNENGAHAGIRYATIPMGCVKRIMGTRIARLLNEKGSMERVFGVVWKGPQPV